MKARATTTAILASALAVGLAASLAPAQSIWDAGGGMNPDWTLAANWLGDVLPAQYANVEFGSGGAQCAMHNGVHVTDITFNRAADFQLLGSNGGWNMTDWTRDFFIHGNITVSAAHTYTMTARARSFEFQTDSTIDVCAGGKLIFDTETGEPGGIISGNTITKTGAGELEFKAGEP